MIGKFKLFAERSLAEYLARRRAWVDSALRRTTEDYILNVNETEYTNYLIDLWGIKPLVIDFDKITIQGQERPFDVAKLNLPIPKLRSLQAQYDFEYFITFRLPFFGPYILFDLTPGKGAFFDLRGYIESPHLKPQDSSVTEPTEQGIEEVCAKEGEFLCFEVRRFYEDAEGIKQLAVQAINFLKQQLDAVNQEVTSFNEELRNHIQEYLSTRKQIILDNHHILAALNIPIKKRDDLPQTYAIPTPQIQKKLSVMPIVQEKGYTPEPTLDQSTYHDILQIIYDLGKVFERYPSIYSGKGEEALRDLILLYLAPRFGIEGSVTGETFNKSGKTDILIRYRNSNVFIAECKFWKGEKLYLSTITQLLGYLSWRDSKAAVVIFVRTGAFSSVIETVKKVTPRHDNYLDFVNAEDETWFNYRFHIKGDKNREVKLTVLLFSIPPEQKYIREIVKMYYTAILDPRAENDTGMEYPPKHLGYLFCPQCGGANLRDDSIADYQGEETYYIVKCEDCGWSELTQ